VSSHATCSRVGSRQAGPHRAQWQGCAILSLNVITESTALAIGLAAALLAFDLLAWRVVAAVLDRERLVTGRHT